MLKVSAKVAAILSGYPPIWVPRADNIPAPLAFDFANQRAFVAGAGVGPPSNFLTVTRASVGYRVNSAGTYESIASNLLRYTYDPTTLASLGIIVEEARTNSIRNNAMTGVVAGVARSIASITGISRTASATAVIACGTHNVVANDMITVSGATPSDYNGTYVVASVTANATISYVTANSTTDSASGYSISAISPGTQPTNWNFANPIGGWARSIVGTGTENGIDYIDIRYAGLTNTTSVNVGVFDGNTTTAAVNGQTWAGSFFITLVGGTIPGSLTFKNRISERDAGGASLTNHDSNAFTPAAGNLRNAINTQVATNTNASTAFETLNIVSNFSNATLYDFTLRIGWPQLELGGSVTSPIRTTAGTAARSSDVVKMLLPTALQNMTAYSMILSATPQVPTNYGSNQAGFGIDPDDGTSNNRAALARSSVNGFSITLNGQGGVGFGPNGATVWAQNTAGKNGQAVQAGAQSLCFNGGTVQTSATATILTSQTTVHVGVNSVGNAGFWNGTIASITLWNIKMSDAGLQRLTT